jgi:hypothetical protein
LELRFGHDSEREMAQRVGGGKKSEPPRCALNDWRTEWTSAALAPRTKSISDPNLIPEVTLLGGRCQVRLSLID